ncbi:hypothetical protein JAAARDRAFT_200457 [Jaapia argillacea MUCL 33604]|uniref:Uncharacterized protein n=1 Tax=Jaapia argillacea MUCL 33604 TaxID=933084 RepID=A0A067P524_9AGAM|nr:hypothetical protein JAAARDRAFT_200457 [Jaapia argillacea MUCL 33604]
MSLASVNTTLLGDIPSTLIDPDQSSKFLAAFNEMQMRQTLKTRDLEIARRKVRIGQLEDMVRELQEDMEELQETIEELGFEPEEVVANELREAVSCKMCRKVMWEPYM